MDSSLIWDISTASNRGSSVDQKQNGKHCISYNIVLYPWRDGSLRAFSSGSILFAQISVLVCKN